MFQEHTIPTITKYFSDSNVYFDINSLSSASVDLSFDEEDDDFCLAESFDDLAQGLENRDIDLVHDALSEIIEYDLTLREREIAANALSHMLSWAETEPAFECIYHIASTIENSSRIEYAAFGHIHDLFDEMVLTSVDAALDGLEVIVEYADKDTPIHEFTIKRLSLLNLDNNAHIYRALSIILEHAPQDSPYRREAADAMLVFAESIENEAPKLALKAARDAYDALSDTDPVQDIAHDKLQEIQKHQRQAANNRFLNALEIILLP